MDHFLQHLGMVSGISSSFIDDYSRYGCLYLLHEKSQALEISWSFKADVENQLVKTIKAIRSNHYGEYYHRYDGLGKQRLVGPST